MQNILLISHGDYDYDGRLRELMKVAGRMGNLYSFTRGTNAAEKNHSLFEGGNYLAFIKDAINFAKAIGDIDILILDNRRAIIPGLIIRQILSPGIVIQDCRELYISKEVKHFTGKAGCWFESIMIKKADIIICAGKKRAEVMRQIYSLPEEPVVYENVRSLQYTNADFDAYEKKYADIIRDDEYRIISTFGCNVERTNDVLIRNLDKINCKVRTLLVGDSSREDLAVIKKICEEKKLHNVEIINTVGQDELKWLINQCHIGVVNYHQKDLNNKYCASGKIYEFLYEGKPVITTTNPPLVEMCNKYHIGVADDGYADGINKIIEDYDLYVGNTKEFAKEHKVEANNEKALCQLMKRIERLQ